ncbi:MAG: DUF4209 domain-containing protein, partial [Pseudolabrys sp.]
PQLTTEWPDREHLLALYVDVRGLNLRNELAHGLLHRGALHGHMARLVLHSLLVLGLWKLAERRR